MSDQKGSNKSSTSQTGTQTQTIDPAVTAALQANLQRAQTTVGSSAYSPISASDIQSFQSPYTAQAVSATNAELAQQNQVANQNNNESATAQGAFGGDRSAVLNALTNGQYAMATGQADANLNNQGFQTALTAAQTQNQNENQYPLLIQQLLNQTLGLNAGAANKTVNSTGNSNTNSLSNMFGFSLAPSGGGSAAAPAAAG